MNLGKQYKYTVSEVLQLFKRENHGGVTNGESSRENVGCTDQLEWCLTGPSPSSEKAWELRLTEGVKAFFVECF